jgi:hypothetical protein
MSKYFHLCWILGALLLLPSVSLAQDRPEQKVFDGVSEEIRYYIVSEDYTLRHYDLLSLDNQAIQRARFLSSNYEKQFIEISKEYLSKADARAMYRLIWIYLHISTPDHRPLPILLSPDSFETTFKNANDIRDTLVNLLKQNSRDSIGVYAVEALAALKYREAIPEMISVLNSETNPNVPLNLIALADLGARNELATYLQEKVLEGLCIAKGHGAQNGVPITAITHKFPAAAQRNPKYAKYFNDLYDSTVWNPDEQALARFAAEGQSERLRGYAMLLLSHTKSEAALNVILDRLENDRSSVVVGWAAYAAVSNPTSRVVDTLIAVYDRSEDAGIRFSCTESLGMIGGEKAILTLRKALNDANPQVREMAKNRLNQLAERRQ